jgi:DNA-binding GntR family transcriptional regulator
MPQASRRRGDLHAGWVALIAAWIPARRAAWINQIQAWAGREKVSMDAAIDIVYDYTMNGIVGLGTTSTPAAIAARLREAIASGRFADGDALPQDGLAEELGVSKIPVREGLRLLEAEGLVAFLPNRGVIVAAMSAAEIRDITEMRVTLETAVLKRAVPHFTAADERRATRALEDLDEARDPARQSALNWQFHAALYTPASRPRQLDAIRRLHLLVDRYMRLILTGLKHQRRSQQEHYRLLKACADRSEKRASDLLAAHIEFAGDLVARHLGDRPRESDRKTT